MNGLPQMLQDRFYFFEGGLVARNHNPKLGLGRFIFAAKDRRIEKIDTTLCISFVFSQTGPGKNRAHVDRDLAFFDSAKNSFRAKNNFLDRLVVTQTVHDKLGLAGVRWTIGYAGAFPGEQFTFFSVPIPDSKIVAGFEKV